MGNSTVLQEVSRSAALRDSYLQDTRGPHTRFLDVGHYGKCTGRPERESLRVIHSDGIVKEVSNHALVNDIAEIYHRIMIGRATFRSVVPDGPSSEPGSRLAKYVGR